MHTFYPCSCDILNITDNNINCDIQLLKLAFCKGSPFGKGKDFNNRN